jgi:hypothetical protein
MLFFQGQSWPVWQEMKCIGDGVHGPAGNYPQFVRLKFEKRLLKEGHAECKKGVWQKHDPKCTPLEWSGRNIKCCDWQTFWDDQQLCYLCVWVSRLSKNSPQFCSKSTMNFLAECKLQCPFLHSVTQVLCQCESYHAKCEYMWQTGNVLFLFSHTLDLDHLHAANIFTWFFTHRFPSEIKAGWCNYSTV